MYIYIYIYIYIYHVYIYTPWHSQAGSSAWAAHLSSYSAGKPKSSELFPFGPHGDTTGRVQPEFAVSDSDASPRVAAMAPRPRLDLV